MIESHSSGALEVAIDDLRAALPTFHPSCPDGMTGTNPSTCPSTFTSSSFGDAWIEAESLDHPPQSPNTAMISMNASAQHFFSSGAPDFAILGLLMALMIITTSE